MKTILLLTLLVLFSISLPSNAEYVQGSVSKTTKHNGPVTKAVKVSAGATVKAGKAATGATIKTGKVGTGATIKAGKVATRQSRQAR